MRLADRFRHVFDAAMKLLSRLALHEKRSTRRAELFKTRAPVPFRQFSQIVRRQESLTRRKRDAARILCLLETLLERGEEFLVGLFENLRFVQDQNGGA